VWFKDHALQIRNVYVEHGHRFDPTTWVDSVFPSEGGEIPQSVAALVERHVTNPTKGLEPFLDNIKPVERLLWTLVQRNPLKALDILRRSIPVLRQTFKPRRLEASAWFILYLATLVAPFVALAVILLAVGGYALAGSLDTLPVNILALIGIVGLAGPYAVGLSRMLRRKRQPLVGDDRVAKRLYGTLDRSGYLASSARVFGVLGHTHRPDVQRLPSFGTTEVLYVNAGSWTPAWRADQTDLTGLVRYTFLRFELTDRREYDLAYLEWEDERNEPVPAAIIEPQQVRQRRPVLSKRERRTLKAFVEAWHDGDRAAVSPTEIAANVETYLSGIKSERVREVKRSLLTVEYFVPFPALRPFSRLPVANRREATQRRLSRSRNSLLVKHLARIRALCLMGMYGDERMQTRMGYIPIDARPANQASELTSLGSPRLRFEDPRGEELSSDLCVIGSGAGGAVVAYHAALAGEDVIVIDQGRYVHSSEMTHVASSMCAALYRDGGLSRVLDPNGSVLQGSVLGGSTVVANGVCFRLVGDPDLRASGGPSVLDEWRTFGASLDESELLAAYRRAEKRLNVTRLAPELAGGNAGVLLDGWKQLVDQGFGDRTCTANLFRKSYHRCGGCGFCSYGCPYERKLSTVETYLSDAIAQGARVIPQCRAIAIERAGTTASLLKCRLNDGTAVRIRARRFVIAGGPIGSSHLLLRSGIRKNVGTRLSSNPTACVFGRLQHPVNGYDGVEMGAFVDAGEFILQSRFPPPVSLASLLPGWFETHVERLGDYPRLTGGSVMVATEPNLRMRRWAATGKRSGPLVQRMTERDFATLKKGIALLGQVYFAAGADSVYVSALRDVEMPARDFASRGRINPGKMARFLDRHIRRPGDLMLEAPYLQGGNPMNDDPAIGVVDSNFRVHGFDNVFVCDASVFPSTTRIHPQLTVMAMADYAWHRSIGATRPT
jgi:choline dehydrogenase-like flavoprotein